MKFSEIIAESGCSDHSSRLEIRLTLSGVSIFSQSSKNHFLQGKKETPEKGK